MLKVLIPLAVLGGIGWGAWYLMEQKTKKPPPTYKTTEVERGEVMDYVSADGTLLPFTTVDVKSKAGGRVDVLAVDVGTRVKAGQLIAKIDPTDSRAAYDTASADLEASNAKVSQAQTSLLYQESMLGPQIAQARSALENARARKLQAQESLRYQKAVFEAQVNESKKKLETAQVSVKQAETALALQVETQRSVMAEAENALRTAKTRLEQAKLQAAAQPTLTDASIAEAETAVKAAQEELSLLRDITYPQEKAQIDATVRQLRSNLDLAQSNLKRHKDLYGQGFIPRNTLESSQNAYDRAQADFDAAEEKERQFESQFRSRIRSAELKREQALASLRMAKANAVQNSLKDQDVQAAQAAYDQATASYQYAQARKSEITMKEQAVQNAQAAMRQAEASLRTTLAGEKQIAVLKAEVKAAEKAENQAKDALQLALSGRFQIPMKAADIQTARASVARSKATLANTKITYDSTIILAPRTGVILKKYVEQGTIISSGMSSVTQGTAIVQLGDVSKMFVDAQVDESDVRGVKPGQPVKITIDAYPDEDFEGKVDRIYPAAELVQNVNVVHVWVKVLHLERYGGRLKPGMSGTCYFILERKENVLKVPREAVKLQLDEKKEDAKGSAMADGRKSERNDKNGKGRKGKKSLKGKRDGRERYYVQLLENEKPVDVPVRTGIWGVEDVEIVSGLKEGDTVIVAVYEQKPAGPGGPGKGPGDKKGSSDKSMRRAMRTLH
jgi:HlyD family secretion protein